MGLLDQHLAFALGHQVAVTGKGAVVWGGVTLDATFDKEERLVPDGSGSLMPRLTTLLRVATADLPPAAAREDSLTIDAVSYRVRSVEPVGDGRVTEVLVALPNG